MKKSIETRLSDLEKASGLRAEADAERAGGIRIIEVMTCENETGKRWLHDVIDLSLEPGSRSLTREELVKYARENGLELEPDAS